jgi:hypothetical protein
MSACFRVLATSATRGILLPIFLWLLAIEGCQPVEETCGFGSVASAATMSGAPEPRSVDPLN